MCPNRCNAIQKELEEIGHSENLIYFEDFVLRQPQVANICLTVFWLFVSCRTDAANNCIVSGLWIQRSCNSLRDH